MTITAAIPHASQLAASAASIESRLAAVATAARNPASGACNMFPELHHDVSLRVAGLKRRILGTALQWTAADKADAAWIGATQRRLAAIASGLAESLAARAGSDDKQVSLMIAYALHYKGESVKCDDAAESGTFDYRSAHCLMQIAMARGCQRDPINLPVDNREAPCTVEALYFRALLLARFAGGILNQKQIEILDTWLGLWLPVLQGHTEPPIGPAFRADLDSGRGLGRGTRQDDGPSLYLPQAPLEEAFESIVHGFHQGCIMPERSLASTFRIEEHMAVLDLLRRGLREAHRPPITRAGRHEVCGVVELFVGLAEIASRGFTASAPQPAALTLATMDGISANSPRLERERDVAPCSVYDRVVRHVRLIDESASGFGFEGDRSDCGQVAVGDLVGIRRVDQSLELGRVMRVIAGSTADKIRLGVGRLSSGCMPLRVVALDKPDTPTTSLLFVPGSDASGRHDGFLVSDIAFAHGNRFAAEAESQQVIVRFNRVRERGRGWVLAGFEVNEAGGEGTPRAACVASGRPL